ncbi:hypothetical protein [Pseudonocardia sp. Ae717_Ps2]|uniref:hypothetical protein n=1 Tax=Pseudonocardia sp. Ae717_Ps2 TaxID=1885573 RepID=UPI000B113BFD|nr:hypothetical protein [Pseudonocardia sp. Ae717_Ps2]
MTVRDLPAGATDRWAQHARERRADRVLDAQLTQDAAAAAQQRRIVADDARTERRRNARMAASQFSAEQRRARGEARRAALARVAGWVDAHVIELLIYPIAVLSFALAAPAMAAYGARIFGAGGFLLAGITELGMWAFAMAVVTARRRYPERPVAGLQAGVVVFSLGAAGMNLLHGLHKAGGGWETGAVMAVVSVAGIVAHQLTLAGAPRSRAERRSARLAARAAAKLDRAQHAAVRDAATVIDTDGGARVVYRAGTYRLRRRRLAIEADLPLTAEMPEAAAPPAVGASTGHGSTAAAGPADGVAAEVVAGPDPVGRATAERVAPEAATDNDGEVADEMTAVIPVVEPVEPALVVEDTGTTKLTQAEILLSEAWTRGEEPSLSEVDRLIDGNRTATKAKRNLRVRGVLPPSERAAASGKSGWRREAGQSLAGVRPFPGAPGKLA